MDVFKQPSLEAKSDLVGIDENLPDIVSIPDTNRKVKIRALHPYTHEMLTKIWVTRDLSRPGNGTETVSELLKDPYFNHKIAALFVLNGFFRIKLFYGLLWRWYAYIRGYREYQLTDIIKTAKKKIPLIAYYRNIMLTMDMRTDWMTMTNKEAEQYRAELISAANTTS